MLIKQNTRKGVNCIFYSLCHFQQEYDKDAILLSSVCKQALSEVFIMYRANRVKQTFLHFIEVLGQICPHFL